MFVAECIANWVHSAVDVAKPIAQLPEPLRNTVFTECGHQYHDVVGRPCNNESQQDGTQGACSFLLSDQRPAAWLAAFLRR